MDVIQHVRVSCRQTSQESAKRLSVSNLVRVHGLQEQERRRKGIS